MPVGNRAIAEVRSGARASVHAREGGAGAGGPGHVLRPTLAGHRFRCTGVAPSTASVRAKVAATANGTCARAPSHLPRHRAGMRRRGTPPRCIRAVVVPPGAGTIRGCRPRLQGTTMMPRQRGAGIDGRPRAWAGERGPENGGTAAALPPRRRHAARGERLQRVVCSPKKRSQSNASSHDGLNQEPIEREAHCSRRKAPVRAAAASIRRSPHARSRSHASIAPLGTQGADGA
jgi:hypothetical protein